jgi:transposase InsO family protein
LEGGVVPNGACYGAIRWPAQAPLVFVVAPGPPDGPARRPVCTENLIRAWQNGFAERLIGSIRRECLDHIMVLGEAHLRRILKSYARYYNETRTHLALEKDAPLSRTVKRAGRILCRPVPGGLHHEYVRI